MSRRVGVGPTDRKKIVQSIFINTGNFTSIPLAPYRLAVGQLLVNTLTNNQNRSQNKAL